jgi:hypothetical protein
MSYYFSQQTRQTCMAECNNNPKYNPQLQCGGSSAPMAILGGETDTARCIAEKQREQQQCKVDCNTKFKDTPK